MVAELCIVSENAVQIFMKNLQNKSLRIEVEMSESIAAVNERICSMDGVPKKFPVLVHKGSQR